MDLSNSSSTVQLHNKSASDLPASINTPAPYGLGWRHVQALLIFSGFLSLFCLRINMSVAIVPMTDKNNSNPDFPEFDWSPKERGAILSAFFWGYLIAQFPAGLLGLTFSPKILLLISTMCSGFLTMATPSAAFFGGVPLVCAIRVVMGICQGFMVPLTYSLISKWAPPTERNRFLGYSLNGAVLGMVFGFPIFGLLAKGAWGWPSIFYFSSVLAFAWSLLYWLYGANSPAEFSRISPEERNYIETSLSQVEYKEKPPVPWKHIFKSVPFWALVVAQVGYGWGFSIVLTQTPSYFNNVLNLDIRTNGFLAAVPYLSMWLVTFPVCYLADHIKKKNLLSDNFVRKTWTIIAMCGSSVPLIIIGYVGKNTVAVISLLTIGVSLHSFLFSGFFVNHLDLSPNFAPLLMGFANGLENITTILAPLTVGWIVTDLGSVEQWRNEFWVTFCVSVIPAIGFVIFGKTEEQYWNRPENLPENKRTNRDAENKVEKF
ncbi:high affinity inorganic phosphate:sodium symporter activity [Nesidiocoris tenuis]|uniref:High affinity inorganic phosphate:sodium symporter activity n=1 Tax=Nesidiocoris tenuis TaxID=355587 RepID=A0ABN7AV69_9HEMI|nr:high affinity inorganic phosphate:sodium symporter activity [Nesidiocoris tenuis]